MKHQINHKLRYAFLFLFIAMFFNACDGSYRGLEEKRKVKNTNSKGDIVIGVVTSKGDAGMFLEGITLAMNEINEDGGLFDRKIKFVIRDDEGRVDKGMEIARKLAHDTNISAVIGHVHSEVAISVSMIYESAGILFISPGATDQRLTHQKDNKYIFRNIPSDDVILSHMVDYCREKGINRFAVIYDRKESTTRQAYIFKELAKSSGLEIVTNLSYFSWRDDYQLMASKLMGSHKFDGVFLFGQLPAAGQVIRNMRELGCKEPFFSMPVLDSPRLGSIVGRGAEGTIVPTVFYPSALSKITRKFVSRFETIYRLQPDTMAAQGFDALMLLAHAIQKKGSTVPIVMASVLRFLEQWQGVTGKYGFTVNGDVQGNVFYFKEFKNGRFQYQEPPGQEGVSDPFYVIEDTSLRIPIKREVSILDPGKFLNREAFEIVSQIFTGLTQIDPRTSKPVPALAEAWTENADGTRYIFKLRKNLKWSNGDNLTAHDIVWSIRRNLAFGVQNQYTETLSILKNAQAYMKGKLKDISRVGVHALADDMVEFELSHPVAYFTSLVSLNEFKPVPRAVIEQYKENWIDPSHIITSGPYTLAFWGKGMKIVLRKNLL